MSLPMIDSGTRDDAPTGEMPRGRMEGGGNSGEVRDGGTPGEMPSGAMEGSKAAGGDSSGEMPRGEMEGGGVSSGRFSGGGEMPRGEMGGGGQGGFGELGQKPQGMQDLEISGQWRLTLSGISLRWGR